MDGWMGGWMDETALLLVCRRVQMREFPSKSRSCCSPTSNRSTGLWNVLCRLCRSRSSRRSLRLLMVSESVDQVGE